MHKLDGWDEAKASTGEYESLKPGGYVVKIISAEDKEDKEYFEIIWDIAEGPEKERFKDDTERVYSHRLVRSYKSSAVGMFKGFIKAVSESNGIDLSKKAADGILTEDDLKGRIFGAVMGYEEYLSSTAEERGEDPVKQKLIIRVIKPAEDIRQGNFKIPDVKKLSDDKKPKKAAVSGFNDVTDEDIPF